jgi:hypothetical protein
MIDSGHDDKTPGREGGLLKIRLNAAASQRPRKFRGWKLLQSSVVLSFSIFAEIDRRFPCRSLSPERRPIWSRRRNIQRSRCS